MGKFNNSKGNTNFNITITVMFETYSGNYMTPDLTEERIREIQEAVATLKTGDTLFLKKSKTPNKSGKHSYFLEIADPKSFKKNSENNDL